MGWQGRENEKGGRVRGKKKKNLNENMLISKYASFDKVFPLLFMVQNLDVTSIYKFPFEIYNR